MKTRTAMLGIAVLLGAVGSWMAATHPPDALQEEYVRIIHVHVPSSWLAFLAFFGTLAGGAGWLATRRAGFDHFAAASAEIGVFFTALSLLTGMIWGKVTWGIAWDWGDARMASTALMFFVYLGYLALRRSIPDPDLRARRASVVGILAFLQVPLVYFSVNLFRTLHQTQSVRPDGWTIEDGSTVAAMLVNLAAFTFLYLGFVIWRTSQETRLATIEESAGDELPAGAAVVPPTLGLSDD